MSNGEAWARKRLEACRRSTAYLTQIECAVEFAKKYGRPPSKIEVRRCKICLKWHFAKKE